jgi:hypothetical protein
MDEMVGAVQGRITELLGAPKAAGQQQKKKWAKYSHGVIGGGKSALADHRSGTRRLLGGLTTRAIQANSHSAAKQKNPGGRMKLRAKTRSISVLSRHSKL